MMASFYDKPERAVQVGQCFEPGSVWAQDRSNVRHPVGINFGLWAADVNASQGNRVGYVPSFEKPNLTLANFAIEGSNLKNAFVVAEFVDNPAIWQLWRSDLALELHSKISIVGVATVDGDPRRAGVQPRAESTLSPHFQLKDAA